MVKTHTTTNFTAGTNAVAASVECVLMKPQKPLKEESGRTEG